MIFQYSVRPPSWIGKFLKFSHVSVAWVKICVWIPNFVIFGRFAAKIWKYNDFQNGGRPPCWIYCDVIILYRKTEFNVLDIVLNFDIHRFHTFWYTSTIMFHHFSLKLPVLPKFSRIFWKNMGNIKFKYCNPQKAHLWVRPRVLNSRCLTCFYICDLYTRRKNRLIDCVLVRKTRSSADADKPARCVWRSVKVTKHSTIPYVRYSFLLCNSNFVFKTRCFYDIRLQKMLWPWNGVKGHSRSLTVVSFDRWCTVSY